MIRSRAAVLEAARDLFLRNGYAGTTMADIAAAAGLTKRTVYNNYTDKQALFIEIVRDATAYADAFARQLPDEFAAPLAAREVPVMLGDLGRRLALAIVRPDVIALRRLLIGEAREFPALAEDYFDRAPGQVMTALAAGFARFAKAGLLHVPDPRVAAAQFAYLIAGAALDRAVLVGSVPPQAQTAAAAREGVATFLARYGPAGTSSRA